MLDSLPADPQFLVTDAEPEQEEGVDEDLFAGQARPQLPFTEVPVPGSPLLSPAGSTLG